MYIITLSMLLALGTFVSSNPLPTAETPESATVVDVASSSYSSLIVFNPAAVPTSSGSETYLTPSGITVPEAATLSLQGNLPSASTVGASESGVRVVGQGSSGMENGTASDGGDQENSASTASKGGWLFVGVGSAVVLGSGLV